MIRRPTLLRPAARRLVRAVVFSIAAAAVTALLAYAGSYLIFPVTGLQVTGARMFPESEAWRALPDHASLLTLNTDALEGKIESNPWVQGAEVLKNWDSGIVTVEVKERRAVLSGVLGGHEVFYSADGEELPGAGGARLVRVGLDEGRLQEILGIIGVLNKNGVALESVDGADAGGITATVAGRRVLLAGSVEAGQARALGDLMEEHRRAGYFDLRSPGRVVVGEPGA